MRVLVTGARGFVGRHVVATLRQQGIEVRILTRAPLDAAGASVVVGALHDRSIAAAAVRDVDAVVHLAARVHVMREDSAEPLVEFRRANVDSTIALAEAARAEGVRTFVLASSVKAVGDATVRPWTRETVATPVDPYGVSKREAEVALARIASQTMQVVMLRFPVLYGPGMKGNMLALMRLIDHGRPIPVSTRPNARSLLYVRNAASAIAHLVVMRADPVGTAPYFVTDGAPSTRELVHEVAAALGRRGRILPVPAAPARAAARAADTLLGGERISARVARLFGSLEVDGSDFMRDFDFRFPFTRAEGLADTARWFRESQETTA